MDVVPFTFRPAAFIHPNLKGYWITLFMFFDGVSTHTFYHQEDMLDNMLLAQECGFYCYPLTREILVTPSDFKEIFYKIEDYVSNSCND